MDITDMEKETNTMYQNFEFLEKIKLDNMYQLAKFYNVHFFKLSHYLFFKKNTQKTT